MRQAEAGARFEFVWNLRRPGDECYGDVASVVAGDRSRERDLSLAAGDLQLFLGRYSLHRVTPNHGTTYRLLLIMSFCEQPGVIGNRVRVRSLYGKTASVHDDPDSARPRPDALLD